MSCYMMRKRNSTVSLHDSHNSTVNRIWHTRHVHHLISSIPVSIGSVQKANASDKVGTVQALPLDIHRPAEAGQGGKRNANAGDSHTHEAQRESEGAVPAMEAFNVRV